MAKIDPSLVPAGMSVAREITPHCFINGDGQVIFLRQQEGNYIPAVLATVHDAIAQCFHILDSAIGEVVDFYRHQSTIRAEGEIGQMRGIVLEIQQAIARLISPRGVSAESAAEIQTAFGQIVRRLGQVRNAHKLAVIAGLNQYKPDQTHRLKHLGEILAPAAAHLAALKRFDELLNITEGVAAQARGLIYLTRQGEDRVRQVYNTLSIYEARVGEIVKEIERIQRVSGIKCPPRELSFLRRIAHEVSYPGSNKVVNALNGIAPVEPFKSRIESAEVARLSRLAEYLDQWQMGKTSALYTFQRTFGVARAKLKRLVRERLAGRELRTLESQYDLA